MANQQRGSVARVIIDMETAFNEAPAKHVPQVLYLSSESVRMSRNLVSSKTLRSSRMPLQPVRGNEEVAGDINFELNPQCGRLLKHALGTYNGGVTNPGGGYYHEFKIGDLTSLCLEKGFADLTTKQYLEYSGLKVNTFKVSGKTEGMIDCTMSLMGCKETVTPTTPILDSSPTDLGCTPFDGFGGSVYLNGSAVAEVTSIDFTLENGLDGNTYVMNGTGTRYSLPEGTAKVTGTLTALFTDQAFTYYQAASAHTEKSLKLEFKAGTGVGTVGNEKMTFYMDEVLFRPQAPVIQGPTGLLIELPFEAYYANYPLTDSEDNALSVTLLCPTVSFNL